MKFKILKIYAKNFKGFEEISFDCNGKDAIILGGKNGFGKTTLFDAVELALTGEIKRYKNYIEEYADKRLSRTGDDKPLVRNINQDEVVVQVDVLLNSSEYLLRRVAKTDDIGFQLNFKCFGNLTIKKKINGEWSDVKDKREIESCISEIKSNYSRFYYVSQEETLEYLKTNEKDRPEKLQQLFDVSFFENRIKTIKKICDVLKSKKTVLIDERVKIEVELQGLDENLPNEKDAIAYEKIAIDVDLPWDAEKFDENFDFKGTLAANGVIEKLLYYVENEIHYKKYLQYQLQNELNKKKEIIAYWFQYRALADEIEKYKLFVRDCVNPVNQISLNTLSAFSFEKFNQTDSGIESLKSTLSSLKMAEKSFNGLQRAYGQLDEVKALIIPYMTDGSKIHNCPLCGHDYENASKLAETLRNYTHKDDLLQENIHKDLIQNIALFKKNVLNSVITPKLKYYEEMGITEDVVKKIDRIPIDQRKNAEHLIQNVFKIIFSDTSSCNEKIDAIEKHIASNKIELDNTVEYDRLVEIYNNVAHLISSDKLTIDCIKRKRQYLINCWNKANSKKKNELIEKISIYKRKIDKANSFEKSILKSKKSLEKAKKEYLNKIINDVKILFYIYSGRIMQDCFYGRGLFLVYNTDKGYVCFTSNPNSCVDALYNLSSGQMVALILSFTLSLNKLYRKNDFMLIDDPIQCIDDINMWGFIETIRHEFQNYSFIFSTHEAQYGSLLRYRLDKLGFNVEYRDLFKEGKRN
ncbi:AAA family ATPase [uncultured Fibrobacter sp.]|uniref:AAA family ATPase n=1 Tax=uncultured Fibrobacter sp. TaxID=261512 RepID=UPI0025E5988F|nr:AAA family ATPase [uncultured Fibrobacter sp.]